MFDTLLLARIQFAFTISFHIIFPSITIGLATWLAVLEWRFIKTNNHIYKDLYQFWIKIFALTFALGVVSGVVMSYQFGTNWSAFSNKVGSVIGPLLGYEVLTAFFLEASFLGIMIFGWGRVSKRMHFFSTLVVAVGTVISAFWIISANSWMQTPQGFSVAVDGRLLPTDWLAIIFNPSFPYRFFHMIIAAYLTTTFLIAGVSAYYFLGKRYTQHAKKMLKSAVLAASFLAPLQMFIGDLHGLNTLKHQPAKVAAMEGLWNTQKGADLILFGLPDSDQEITRYAVKIPKLASLILTHSLDGEVKGLKSFPSNERPPVKIVFYAFRLMIGIGLLMLITAFWGSFLLYRKQLFKTSFFHRCCFMMAPSGIVAVLCGWFVTEVGRQPFLVYNVIKTSAGISPVVGPQVAASLLIFVIVYTIIFGAGLFYILRLIKKGPPVAKVTNVLEKSRKAYVDVTIEKLKE